MLYRTLLASIIIASQGAVAQEVVIYVDQNATGPTYDGSTWCQAFSHVQDALELAAAGTTIKVADATYKPDKGANQVNRDRAATFALVEGTSLEGGYAGCGAPDPDERLIKTHVTILSGDLDDNDGPGTFQNAGENSYRVVSGPTDETTRISGFSIVGGNANGPTGSNNDFGGAMVASAGIIEDCVFRGNRADQTGGAIYAGGVPGPTVLRCVFENNHAQAQAGGGIDAAHSMTIRDSRFVNNFHGAIYNTSASSHIDNCVFIQNDLAAIVNSGTSDPQITNCTFYKNSTGIRNLDSTPIPTVTNCVFWEDVTIAVDVGDGSAVVNHSLVPGGWVGAGGIGILDVDPLFVDADGLDNVAGTSDDNLRLHGWSPCIDSGDNSVVTEATDLDGSPRIVDGDVDGTATVDLGAYEYQGQEGACCLPDNTCVAPVSQVDCSSQGGLYAGDGSRCACSDQPPVPALSSWSMGFFLLLILTAGSLVLSRRRVILPI